MKELLHCRLMPVVQFLFSTKLVRNRHFLPLAMRTNVRYNIINTRNEGDCDERTHLHLHRSEVFLRVG